jgi:hypothetical protein
MKTLNCKDAVSDLVLAQPDYYQFLNLINHLKPTNMAA